MGESKKYRVELDDDNFEVFSACNEREAQEIAWDIAKEYNSVFCELCEEDEE